MKNGKTGQLARLPVWTLLLLIWPLPGCATRSPHMDRELMLNKNKLTHPSKECASYQLGCPDILEVTVADMPTLSGKREVGVDGRVDLGALGRLRVEGWTSQQVQNYLSKLLQVPPEQIKIRVEEFNSQRVYLVGEVIGLQRSVPYSGPETVVEMLQRTGGITRGAEARDVHVIRPRVTDGKQPEVFHVQLEDILVNKDQRTNLRVCPFDQVYVGEANRSRYKANVPTLFRPVYEAVMGLRAKSSSPEGTPSLSPTPTPSPTRSLSAN